MIKYLYFLFIKFASPDMDEVHRLFAGILTADKLNELSNIFERDVLVDSSMNHFVWGIFLLNWTPNWFRSVIMNRIMSLVTKKRFYSKSTNFKTEQRKRTSSSSQSTPSGRVAGRITQESISSSVCKSTLTT